MLRSVAESNRQRRQSAPPPQIRSAHSAPSTPQKQKVARQFAWSPLRTLTTDVGSLTRVVVTRERQIECNDTIVVGRNNTVNGDRNLVIGDKNIVHGRDCRVRGDTNLIIGTRNFAHGCHNKVCGADSSAFCGRRPTLRSLSANCGQATDDECRLRKVAQSGSPLKRRRTSTPSKCLGK